MVHPPMDVVLLASVALGNLVVSGLLLLLLLWSLPLSTVIELAWSTLGIPLGTSVGIVPRLTTLEADIASRECRGVVPCRGVGRSVLAFLREVGVLH